MELIFLVVGIAVGAIGGFLVSKKLSASEQDYQRLEQEVSEGKSSLEKYQDEVAAHLDSSAQLLVQMNDTCKNAMMQMEKSTSLLNKATTAPSAMPYFSEETEAQLRAHPVKTKSSRSRKSEAITEAPRDYSSDPSGIFNDEKHAVTNTPS